MLGLIHTVSLILGIVFLVAAIAFFFIKDVKGVAEDVRVMEVPKKTLTSGNMIREHEEGAKLLSKNEHYYIPKKTMKARNVFIDEEDIVQPKKKPRSKRDEQTDYFNNSEQTEHLSSRKQNYSSEKTEHLSDKTAHLSEMNDKTAHLSDVKRTRTDDSDKTEHLSSRKSFSDDKTTHLAASDKTAHLSEILKNRRNNTDATDFLKSRRPEDVTTKLDETSRL